MRPAIRGLAVPAAIVAMAAMACGSGSSPPRAAADTRHSSGMARTLRQTVVSLNTLQTCLQDARAGMPPSLAAARSDIARLPGEVEAASSRLASCQNGELVRLGGLVGELRPLVPWTVVHAASMAQADGQQAGLSLGQIAFLLRDVAGAGRADTFPARSSENWGSFDRAFRLAIERMARRQRELEIDLGQAQAGFGT